jgi:protein TonB
MAIHRISILDSMPDGPARKAAGSLRLAPTTKNDVFLNAVLEMPTTQQTRRSPLKWFGAMTFHIVIVAVLIIVPLYNTGTIRPSEFHETTLVAPPPPLAPPAPPAGHTVAPHITNAKLNYSLQKLTAPISIPKNVPSSSDNVSQRAPELEGVQGGVPGGVPGGVIGGVLGGLLGGTGTAVPTPPPAPRPVQKVVRVGSGVKPPRQTYSADPVYPPLARETHIWGTVVVDAVIDEHGNVVQARVVSGHPLLMDAALKAVLLWKYEPTTLNGQPVSVELQVQVHFKLNS